jgi:hypothetical protein
MSAVRRRCTLTWSLSATSTPESPPPPAVSLPSPNDRVVTQLTIGYRLDLQVRWYRQAYYREVREGTVSLSFHSDIRDPPVHPLSARPFLAYRDEGHFWVGGVVRTFTR